MKKLEKEAVARFWGTYYCRNDLCLNLVSDAAALSGLTGYTAEEMQSLCHNNLLELIDIETREELQKEIVKQLSVYGSVEVILPVYHKDGRLLWIMNRGQLVTGEDEQEYLTGVLVDITRSKACYDEEKKATRVLQIQAEQDSLTNIYNAHTARKKAEEYLENLEPEADCAMLIADDQEYVPVVGYCGQDRRRRVSGADEGHSE